VNRTLPVDEYPKAVFELLSSMTAVSRHVSNVPKHGFNSTRPVAASAAETVTSRLYCSEAMSLKPKFKESP
jgi:hypothetical protein